MVQERDDEIRRLHAESSEKDVLLDEMQGLLRDKAMEADMLLAEAINVANEVCGDDDDDDVVMMWW